MRTPDQKSMGVALLRGRRTFLYDLWGGSSTTLPQLLLSGHQSYLFAPRDPYFLGLISKDLGLPLMVTGMVPAKRVREQSRGQRAHGRQEGGD